MPFSDGFDVRRDTRPSYAAPYLACTRNSFSRPFKYRSGFRNQVGGLGVGGGRGGKIVRPLERFKNKKANDDLIAV